jgi:hypothetical protein
MDFKLSRIRVEAKRFSYTNDRARIRFLAVIELCKRCGRIVRWRGFFSHIGLSQR